MRVDRGMRWWGCLLAMSLGLPAARGDLIISEFLALNNSHTNPLGDKSDWIEIHNPGGTTVNLSGWYLTDDVTRPTKWAFPALSIAPNAYRLVYADGKYTNPLVGGHLYAGFGLSGGGEYLGLIRPDLSVAHAYAPEFPPQSADVSYGVGPGGVMQFFSPPTPGAANSTGFAGDAAAPQSHPPRGFYAAPLAVALVSATPDAAIYYTTDYSNPGPGNGTLYSAPIPVTNTTVLRAVAHRSGYRPSAIITHTYLFTADIVRQSPTGLPPPGFPASPVNSQILDYGMDPDVVDAAAYAPLIEESLRALPTLSLVTPPDHLFHPTSGIFVNALQDGSDWERPVSVELIDAEAGDEGFQIDCGLRIRGGSSREPDNPKHAFRLFFDSQYGPSTLEYPLFGDEGARSFSKVDLRTEQNYSWSYARDGNSNAMLRDIFARDLQGRTGQPYSRGRFHHLYINGHYWGIFQTDERKEANFGETYLGGARQDYDCVKPDKIGWPLHVLATDGNMDAYGRLHQLYLAGFADNTAYCRAQGMNLDGTRNPAYERLLDVDNLIDYLLTIFYTADKDAPVTIFYNNEGPNNFFALYNRHEPDGWKFMRHDAEHSLDRGATDRTGPFATNLAQQLRFFTPQVLHQALMTNAEYRLRFADRTQRWFFNDGPMAPTNAVALLRERARQIDLAIIAESARWGDSKSATPKTRNNDWLPLVNYIADVWLPPRTAIVLDQLRADQLYPQVAAPVLRINGTSQHGGRIAPGAVLTLTGPGVIYYTLDGTDPRQPLTGNAVGQVYSGGIPLTVNRPVLARSRDGGVWSALTRAVFAIDESSPIRITEIMYNPRGPRSGTAETAFVADDFEFIELCNTGAQTVGLAGLTLAQGVRFDFAEGAVATLGPGEHVVVVSHLEAFKTRYPQWAGLKIAGAWRGKHQAPRGRLSNSGETLILRDAFGRDVLAFDYEDDWYPCTDGEGFALTIRDPHGEPGLWDRKQGWRHSSRVDGSPGADDTGDLLLPPGSVVINETLTHQDVDPPGDWIELLNTTDTPISIGGWYLSDSPNRLTRYRIPDGTWITNTLVFTEAHHFGPAATGTNGFALSELGEGIYLSAGSGSALAEPAYREAQIFGASENGVTFGRWVRSDGAVDFPAMAAATPNAPNSGPLVGPVVISELMYHPLDGDPEFLELANNTAAPVPLFDPAHPANTWWVRGIGFTFPPGITLPAGARLWLVQEQTLPATFRAHRGLPPEALVFTYPGKLDNSGETITLERPVKPEPGTGYVPYIEVDRVKYRDVPPWPMAADGRGASLQRVSLTAYGNDPASWNTGFDFVEMRIATGADDVEQTPMRGVLMIMDDPVLRLGAGAPDRHGAGLRYGPLPIPPGSTIAAAFVQFTSAGTSAVPAHVQIRAQAAANAAPFTNTEGDLSDRPLTAASATWDIPAWHLLDRARMPQRTPDITAVIQEVVDQPGWQRDHSLALVLLYPQAGPGRAAWTREGRADSAPLLYVAYVPPPAETTTTTSTTTTSSSTTTTSTTTSTTTAGTDPVAVTLVAQGSVWKYLDNGTDQGTAWRQPGFDDSAWPSGPAQLGYGDGDEATVIGYGPDPNNRYITTYFRRPFTIADPARVQSLTLRLLRDDGAVVYLNGTEVWRDNMPAGVIGYQTLAAVGIGAPQENTFYTNTIGNAHLVAGENIIAVSVHQAAVTSSDLSFDFEWRALILEGPALRDDDDDGMPDEWEDDVFIHGTAAGPHEDDDDDGLTNLQEYIAGTNPTDADDTFVLDVALSNGQVRVRFIGIDTVNRIGYTGLSRYYMLSESTNLLGAWMPIDGYTRLPGRNLPIVYTNAIPAGSRAYRVGVWLE